MGETPNHFVVAAQEYLDLDGDARSAFRDFSKIVLAPWTVEQMDVYVRQWYAELACQEWVDGESARDMSGQLRASLRREEVMALAQRPSLMALIALQHMLQGGLATSPVRFYHELVELGLWYWSEGGAGDERDLRHAFDVEGLRAVVAQRTYQGYTRLERANELVELSARDLRAALINVCRDGRWEAVGHLATRILTRPGFLGECGPDVYAFSHPSLQVYVVARYLAEQPDLPRLVSRLAREDFYRWREVISLAIARLAWLGEDLPTAIALIEALCGHPLLSERENESVEEEWHAAWLAGDALADIADAFEVRDISQTLDCVQAWLVALVEEGRLAPLERARAGNALDRLPGGDPRPGVSSSEPVWCEVADSPFWQGEGEAARLVELDRFWISRYPVTNAQYTAFVNATGHVPPAHWPGGRPQAGMGNHPVVYVTWEDAIAYCKWWAARVRDGRPQVWRGRHVEAATQGPLSWTVRLPTSAEWEKAARGGLLIPTPEKEMLVDNPLPRRAYPWGDSWRLSTMGTPGDETRCNVSESDVGTTTPTGMYPSGASPYGVMDMVGNVWEWCFDWADEEARYKVRRGGAFRYTHEHARCAAYDKAYPGLAWPHMGFRMVFGPPVPASLALNELDGQ
jgi:formylglycine-generating enzyme required for sulfatase activity